MHKLYVQTAFTFHLKALQRREGSTDHCLNPTELGFLWLLNDAGSIGSRQRRMVGQPTIFLNYLLAIRITLDSIS
jgi:hypothetical protein